MVNNVSGALRRWGTEGRLARERLLYYNVQSLEGWWKVGRRGLGSALAPC